MSETLFLKKKKKKIFFILFKTYKNRSDFSVIKNLYFYFFYCKGGLWFLGPKDEWIKA